MTEAQRITLIRILFLGLLAGILTILLLGNFGHQSRILRSGPGYRELEGFTQTSRPLNQYAGVEHTYTVTLPYVTHWGDNLSIYLVHQYAEVWLDDELVACSEETPGWHIGKTPGCYWFHIPVSETDSGRTLKIVTRPLYKIVADRMPMVALSTFDRTLSTWVSNSLGELVLSVICIVSGLLFMILAFIFHQGPQERKQILYLGVFSLTVGIWRLFDLPVLPLCFPNLTRTGYYLAMLGLILSPPLFARLLRWMPTRGSRLYGRLSILLMCEALALILLQVLNVLDLRSALYFIFATLVVAMLPIFVLSIQSLIHQHTSKLMTLLDIIYICFVLALSADMLRYLLLRSSYHLYMLPVVTVLHLIVMGAVIFRRTLESHRQMYETRAELEQERARVMLSQIQPHFLYNSLGVIRELCYSDPAKAEEATVHFSQYLRKNMDSLTSDKPIPFSAELEHVKNYLALEQLRFGDALRVEYDIGETNFLLPPLTLQPIVENAVRHGIRKREDGGTVFISVRRAGNRFCIQVRDDGPGFDPGSLPAGDRVHIGISNVRRRLGLLGGSLEVSSVPGEGTTITIFVPA